jgi:hypothetical protein
VLLGAQADEHFPVARSDQQASRGHIDQKGLSVINLPDGRLAQEIIVTQQSEIDVMKLALKNFPVLSQKQNKKSWCSR